MAKTEPAKWSMLRGYVACYALYIGLIIPGTIAVFLILTVFKLPLCALCVLLWPTGPELCLLRRHNKCVPW